MHRQRGVVGASLATFSLRAKQGVPGSWTSSQDHIQLSESTVGCPGPPHPQPSSEPPNCRQHQPGGNRAGWEQDLGFSFLLEQQPNIFLGAEQKIGIFIQKYISPLWPASKADPEPYSREGTASGCEQHQQVELRDQELGTGGACCSSEGKARLVLMGSCKVSAQCGLLKLPSPPQIKERRCLFQAQEERRGRGRACCFLQRRGMLQGGHVEWHSSASPGATAGLTCSLAHTVWRHLKWCFTILHGNSGDFQPNGLRSIFQSLFSVFLWQPLEMPSVLKHLQQLLLTGNINVWLLFVAKKTEQHLKICVT